MASIFIRSACAAIALISIQSRVFAADPAEGIPPAGALNAPSFSDPHRSRTGHKDSAYRGKSQPARNARAPNPSAPKSHTPPSYAPPHADPLPPSTPAASRHTIRASRARRFTVLRREVLCRLTERRRPVCRRMDILRSRSPCRRPVRQSLLHLHLRRLRALVAEEAVVDSGRRHSDRRNRAGSSTLLILHGVPMDRRLVRMVPGLAVSRP